MALQNPNTGGYQNLQQTKNAFTPGQPAQNAAVTQQMYQGQTPASQPPPPPNYGAVGGLMDSAHTTTNNVNAPGAMGSDQIGRLGGPKPTNTLGSLINNPTYGQAQLTGATTPQAPPGEGFGPGFGETYGKEHVGQYDQPTMLETFAQQQLNGNNPYYDRLRQQGMDQLNQQMIARGHGNSGGALAALGNFQGALGAAQFADMGNLLQGAGSQGLQREGQGYNMASGVQNQQQQRQQNQFSNLLGLTNQGANTIGGFYAQGGQQSGDAAMQGINARTNAYGLQGQGQNAWGTAVTDVGKSLFMGK